jgi:hypothetical protein
MANDSHDPHEGASVVDTTRGNSSTEELRREDAYRTPANTTGNKDAKKGDRKSAHQDH